MNVAPAPIEFVPIAELTPAIAEREYQKARFYLSGRNPAEALSALGSVAERLGTTWQLGLLPEKDVPDRLWEAATIEGLVQKHGADAIQDVISHALEAGASAVTELLQRKSDRRVVVATPYSWTDPEKIPQRVWLYGKLLIRKFLSATVAPGGVGKSSLAITEALAMVSGKPLLGIAPPQQLRVWLWNLEDPQEETTRKIQAAALHYGLTAADIGDRLFVNSGRDQPLVIAAGARGVIIARPVIDGLISEIKAHKIDVLIIDPFVSCHEVSENDNSAIDMVVKEWSNVADRGNCAVHLIHHTRKMNGSEAEVTTETSRGAKALTDGCRVVRAINRMTEEQGNKARIANHRLYFRAFNDKANLAPPADKSNWYRLESVDLGNSEHGLGDSVGVVVPWEWPDAFDGVTKQDLIEVQRVVAGGDWRRDPRSPEWVGIAVAKVLRLDLDDDADKANIKTLLKTWIETGALEVVFKDDGSRHQRPFVEVGQWANT
jgi:hypothetical protein